MIKIFVNYEMVNALNLSTLTGGCFFLDYYFSNNEMPH